MRMKFSLRKHIDAHYEYATNRLYTASNKRIIRIKLTRFTWDDKKRGRYPATLDGRVVLHAYDLIRVCFVRKHNLKAETASQWVRELDYKAFPRFLLMEDERNEIYFDYKGAILFVWEVVGVEKAQEFVKIAPEIFKIDEAVISDFLIALLNEGRTPLETIFSDPYCGAGAGAPKCSKRPSAAEEEGGDTTSSSTRKQKQARVHASQA